MLRPHGLTSQLMLVMHARDAGLDVPGTWAADAHDARPLRLTSQLMRVMLSQTRQELGRLMLMMLARWA